MKILAIETSCDETAIAILEGNGDESRAHFSILGNALLSQIDIHKEYGGVFPAVAKREHAKNLVPVLTLALKEANLYKEISAPLSEEKKNSLKELLTHEQELYEQLIPFFESVEKPVVDTLAVTHGPGLPPALWVGVNFARALSYIWDIPLVPVNHMEGHILSALALYTDPLTRLNLVIEKVRLPLLALLISGGHTELVLMSSWLSYELVGQTKDDAVGEAFDKVARMMNLSYPGGPEISKLAEKSRLQGSTLKFALPRPMIDHNTCDFSFSGLKTSVLYTLQKIDVTDEVKEHIAHEFENAVGEVLLSKTERAVREHGVKTLVLGGGVSANTHIQREFKKTFSENYTDVSLCIPHPSLTTDNAIMIALAGFYRALRNESMPYSNIHANGNLTLANKN